MVEVFIHVVFSLTGIFCIMIAGGNITKLIKGSRFKTKSYEIKKQTR